MLQSVVIDEVYFVLPVFQSFSQLQCRQIRIKLDADSFLGLNPYRNKSGSAIGLKIINLITIKSMGSALDSPHDQFKG